jgi:hypothetical protein
MARLVLRHPHTPQIASSTLISPRATPEIAPYCVARPLPPASSISEGGTVGEKTILSAVPRSDPGSSSFVRGLHNQTTKTTDARDCVGSAEESPAIGRLAANCRISSRWSRPVDS